jgi:hypothetical protein
MEKMTRIYGTVDEYFDYKIITHVNPDTVWVEIGSERGEGSTINLLARAQKFNIKLHTVDISGYCNQQLQDPELICHIAIGSEWTKNYAQTVGKKISLIHLDNFDWIWNPYDVDTFIQVQIEDYKNKFGMLMNNQRCQQEHFAQVLDLLPWFADDCLVAMDDTFLDRGSWSGKCGPAVTYLLLNGFRIVATNAGGTVMARGYAQIPKMSTDHILNCRN